jgi:hypothetical protein
LMPSGVLTRGSEQQGLISAVICWKVVRQHIILGSMELFSFE